jgi:hypothetical protein
VLRHLVNDVQHRSGDFTPEGIKYLMNGVSDSVPGNTPGHVLLAAVWGPNSRAAIITAKEIDAINTRLELMSEQEYTEEDKAVADWYRALEPIGRLERARQPAEFARVQSRFKAFFFLSLWRSSASAAFNSNSRHETMVRGTLCLCALARWQLAHPAEPPRDLTSVLGEAGVKEIPIDPYSGQPFRLAMVAGKPVIYSIGPDGIDDHGQFDDLNGRNASGDLLFQLR